MAEPCGMQRDTEGGTPVPRPRHSQDPPRVPPVVAVPRCRWPGRWLPGWPPATGRTEVTGRLSPRQGHRAEGHGAGGRPPGATGAGAVPMALSRCHRGAWGGRGVLGQSWGSLGSPRSRVPPGRPHNKRTPPFLPHNLAVAPLGGTIAPPPPSTGGYSASGGRNSPKMSVLGGLQEPVVPNQPPPHLNPPPQQPWGALAGTQGTPPRFGRGGPAWETLLGGQRGGGS